MRKLIAGMKISLDGKVAGSDGYPDWVEAWSDDYGVTPRIDACVLGSSMYGGYEEYWTAVRDGPGTPLRMTGKLPTPAELHWARFAAQTQHYVLSSARTAASWPNTSFIREIDGIAALKRGPGKDIYLVGGARTVASCIDAGLLDELHLLIYPYLASGGATLFGTMKKPCELELRQARQLPDGRTSLIHTFGTNQ